MSISKRTINGREMNPVGLGCMSLSWAYGVPPSEEDASKLLHRALDLGYDHLDTANIYGLGHNETLIGNALKSRRKEFFLATKMGLVIDGDKRGVDCSPAAIRKCVEESLTRLQTDHIDLYYMHRRDFTVPIEESVGAMAELIEEGKIGSIGLSEMSAKTLRQAAAEHPIAAVQTEYSLWTRNPEIAVLGACKDLGTTLVAFSPVARGVLANGVRDVNALAEKDLRRNMPRFNADNWPNNLELVNAFNAIAEEEGVTPAQLSLSWILSRGEHVVAIPGTASIAHLEENLARWDWELSADTQARLDALINQQSVAGPRYGEMIQKTIDTEEFA
ncbi:aldo/keto reductase [Sphingorhabdus sp. YGSMI21]|uniref:aldo/keto reductase n=1 Tax=Sphingorhabdus sp. YGSMI21 TaxID=2077182 RepID=UPI000C1F834B|nr:aldo/keto reductase [Sphingorhabdus sp. YGSMI21]ATW02242.1 aldo/keto reductase [Sphingorhabdus sp. YGSMI21]